MYVYMFSINNYVYYLIVFELLEYNIYLKFMYF